MVLQNPIRPVLRNVLRNPGDSPFGGFLPSDLPGLEAWFRYNQGVTVTGRGVSQWDDQSGNDRHFLQGTDVNRPLPGTLSSEIAENGDFATDTVWTKQTGWTIAAGVAHCDGTQSANTRLYHVPSAGITAGKSYLMVYTISNYVAGTVHGKLGGDDGAVNSANGTYTEIVVAGSDNTRITMHADSDFVADIDDVSVKEIDFLEGILCDGISQFIKTAPFTLSQPTMICVLGRYLTYTVNDTFFDGNSASSQALIQNGGTPQVQIFAGSTAAGNTDWAVGTFAAVTSVFNGAGSSIKVGNNAETTGNPGAGNAGGLTLGGRAGAVANGHIQAKEIIVYSADYDEAIRQAINSYLASI